jgi:myo-inositol-1(or 4)-monophosphatase
MSVSERVRSDRELKQKELQEIEDVAVELATLAGAEITRTLGSIFTVRYKTGPAGAEISLRDPVSEVDGRIESLIRARIGERFPEHDIIGEEMKDRLGGRHEYLWAVDPIDGTTNFVNGFPLFAASIGVLCDGKPVVGALWCSITHALRAGVYHAHDGGPLRFESDEVTPRVNPEVRRKLAGVPVALASDEAAWETRKTGSAAVECALVAAGLMQVARFASPNIWDVAGGLALVRAAGREVRWHDGNKWVPMGPFTAMRGADGVEDLRHWHGALVVGTAEAVAQMCQ